MKLGDCDLVSLAKAARGGAAFEELVRRHQAALRAFLIRLTGEASLADDLAQEAFIKAWRAIDSFRGGASFRSWLFAIAMRELAMARRKGRASDRVKEALAEEAGGDEATPSMSLDLQRALTSLGEEERMAVLLCDAAGFSHAEAASVMAAPLGTVKTYVARARARLRDMLETDEQPECA